MTKPNTLICTIGTSLIHPNLSSLSEKPQTDPVRASLSESYIQKDWRKTAAQLNQISPDERLCGAEINSVSDLLTHGEIEKLNLHLLHSDTDDGRAISEILQYYFQAEGWRVKSHCVGALQDDDPRLFRTRGLRNLAKILGELMREAGGAEFCAINATGGYKAQIAIAVLMGQALNIPVYYKHERFDAIIPFPPMPVALDFSLWENASGMFMALNKDIQPYEQFKEDWDERFEPLVNRIMIDDVEYLELSATGQIFHETFLSRFQQSEDASLPRDATDREKEKPKLGHHAYQQAREPISRFLDKLTDDVPYIRYCHSTYWNPDLSETTRFRQSSEGVQGIFSNGTWCVKFLVVTTEDKPDRLSSVVASLNDWLDKV